MSQLASVNGKRALIVDDSRSARAFLARILEEYELEVDSAESAEEAIDYLARARPDVIFMDHLMPGMDGFQAVQSIKNNPRTATIPIMMYTSQEGELYLGQARALGAVGVLPKQVKPAEVSTVLYQLHLIADRRTGKVESLAAGNAAAQALLGTTGAPLDQAPPPADGPGAAPAPSALDALMAQVTGLREELGTVVIAQSDRVSAELRGALQQWSPASALPPSRAPWVVAVLASLGAVAFAALWWQETRASAAMVAGRVAAEAEAGLARAETVAARAETVAARAEAAAARAALLAPAPAVSGLSGTSMLPQPGGAPLVLTVPYGEVPLAGARLDAVQRVLDELVARGVQGVVTLRSFPGRFCLAGDATAGYAPAGAATPASGCALRGNPFEDALASAQRESVALANLVLSVRQRSAGALQVELSAGSDEVRAAAYPEDASRPTAGAWNEIAARNNRVEIALRAPGA